MNILNYFFKPKLSIEAFWCYYNRLPDRIQVNWFRNRNMIIGEVSDGKIKFVTQGVNADNFVEMVNDALITAYNVPPEYCDVIKNSKTFNPTPTEYKKLCDLSIKKSSFGTNKITEQELKPALA